MGGMIIIISPEWAQLKYKSRAEKSGRGIIAKIEFSSGGHKIRIIGAYIPPRSGKTGKGTLESRLGSFTSSIGWKGSPHDYLYDVLGTWVTTGHRLGQFVILSGYLNALMDKLGKDTQSYIRPWIEDLGLASPFTDILLPTGDFGVAVGSSRARLPMPNECLNRTWDWVFLWSCA
jgi:hypothetical protein